MEIPTLNEDQKKFVEEMSCRFIHGDPTDEDSKYTNATFPYIVIGAISDEFDVGIYLDEPKSGWGFKNKKPLTPNNVTQKELESMITYLIGSYHRANDILHESRKNIDLTKTKKIPIYFRDENWKTLIDQINSSQRLSSLH